jgi:hypothetical protein
MTPFLAAGIVDNSKLRKVCATIMRHTAKIPNDVTTQSILSNAIRNQINIMTVIKD